MSKNNHYKFLVTTVIILLVISPIIVFDAKGENVESIYIREDGSIEPSSTPITRDEDTYTLTADLINYFLYIQKTGITIDGAGYKLQGNQSGVTGILVYRDNTTIKNMHISQYGTGILLSSQNNTIIECKITQNSNGISMDSSANQRLIGNSILDNDQGIRISGISHTPNLDENKISYNNLTSNTFGIIIVRSPENSIIKNNNIMDNYVGINLKSSSGIFYSNNFLRNSEHTRVDYLIDEDESPSVCTWDNSTAGNYWDDYLGVDENQDGIGDTPYRITQNNQDNYPLMTSISISQEIIEYRGFYIQKIDNSFIVSENYLETYISPLFSTIEEAKEWIDSGPTTTPTPSTSPTPTGPPPIRFYNPYLILFGSTLLLIALGILAYFKKYRKSN